MRARIEIKHGGENDCGDSVILCAMLFAFQTGEVSQVCNVCSVRCASVFFDLTECLAEGERPFNYSSLNIDETSKVSAGTPLSLTRISSSISIVTWSCLERGFA